MVERWTVMMKFGLELPKRIKGNVMFAGGEFVIM